MTRNAWEVIIQMIRAQGTEYVFGLGDNFINMYAESTPGIKAINLRYEGSAPFMAMAYARLSGNIGVCSASPGPGVANLVPGLLEAYYGCSPLVVPCLSVSRKTKGMGEFQECNQIGMMEPVTKACYQVTCTEMLTWSLNRAFSSAINGQPGPVYIDLPLDVVGAGPFTNYRGLEPVMVEEPENKRIERLRTAGDSRLINEAAAMLAGAQMPVVVAGNGTILSGAFAVFQEFVEIYETPFFTTPCGRGIISENHPLALGLCGLYKTRLGKSILSQADLLLSIGTRNESFQTNRWLDLPGGAKFIQIDTEPGEIGRNWQPDIAIVGDAMLVLEQLVAHRRGEKLPANNMTRDKTRQLIREKKLLEQEVARDNKKEQKELTAKHIIYQVCKAFEPGSILVNENGGQDTWSYCYPHYKVGDALGCIPVAEQTCMGMGVVGAIAAKLTRPEKKVVCITGDAAFQMYMKELPTAAQYGCGCTWVVLNNSSLGWIEWLQRKDNVIDTSTYKIQPDFATIAAASGCYGIKVSKPGELGESLQKALKANQDGVPVVLDCQLDNLDMSHLGV